MKHYAKVIKGKVVLTNKDYFSKDLLSHEGETIEIYIDKYEPKRTISQNKYYRTILKHIGDSLGYTQKEIGEIIKSKFLSEVNPDVISTADLTKKEFTEYLERVIQFGAEQGIVLPDPSELSFHQLTDK